MLGGAQRGVRDSGVPDHAVRGIGDEGWVWRAGARLVGIRSMGARSARARPARARSVGARSARSRPTQIRPFARISPAGIRPVEICFCLRSISLVWQRFGEFSQNRGQILLFGNISAHENAPGSFFLWDVLPVKRRFCCYEGPRLFPKRKT